jgi:hypothetical protein
MTAVGRWVRRHLLVLLPLAGCLIAAVLSGFGLHLWASRTSLEHVGRQLDAVRAVADIVRPIVIAILIAAAPALIRRAVRRRWLAPHQARRLAAHRGVILLYVLALEIGLGQQQHLAAALLLAGRAAYVHLNPPETRR